jgi:hypothetical protein
MGGIADVAGEFIESGTGLLELAEDVSSVVTEGGLEFLNEFGGDTFFESSTGLLTLGSDLGVLDASYELVGSFAGDADFFNFTSFGDIIDSATTSVSDFAGSAVNQAQGFFSGLLNEVPIPTETGVDFVGRTALGKLVDQAGSFVPSFDTLAAQAQKSITQQIVTTGIQTAARAVSGATAQIPVVGGLVSGAVNRTAGAVSTTINQQIAGRPVTIPNLSQLTGITPNIGIPNVPGIQLASLGPVPVNLLKTPTGTVSVTGADGGALNIQTPGINPSATQATVFANYQSSYDPETGQYSVIGKDGLPLEGYSNLTEDLATQIAQEANANAVDAGSLQPTVQQAGPTVTQAVNPETGDYYVPAPDLAPSASAIDRSAGNVGYTTAFDPETGAYAVVNLETGLPVATGLTEQQALLQAQEQTFIDAGEVPPPPVDTDIRLNAGPGISNGIAFDDEGNLLPGYFVGEDGVPVFIGGGFVDPNTALLAEAARLAALRDQARQQQTIRAQRQNQAQAGDWRVRLRLAPNSNYLYNAPDCGQVLWPLRNTDGVIFPYTPTIDTAYKANYDAYDLTHSNYRGYFYKNSYVDQINLKATFTAQDTAEANYLLAVIHFFRSATKMFYGQDSERGSPPPLTYLSGLGDFQFNEHPCVVSQFNYNLPADVNYIRAQSVVTNGTNLLNARTRQTVYGNPLSYALQRLQTLGQGINKGALDAPFAPQGSLGAANPTYVPTKIDISLVLLPMQSRQQVSKQFSVRDFAKGNLLRGGFW